MLLSINDLQTQGWQDFLPYIHRLGDWFHEFKKRDSIRRDIIVPFFGESGRAVGVHASEVSGCLRKLVYGISGTVERVVDPEQIDVNMRMRFQVGTMMHSLLQDDLQRMCMMFGDGFAEFEDEVKINPSLEGFAGQYNVHSSCDGVFTLYAPDMQPAIRVGLEIKTVSGPEYEKLSQPHSYYVDQAHIYMKCLDLPLMWFLYYNKSNSNWTKPMAPYLIVFDPKVLTRLEAKIATAFGFTKAGELPEREEGQPCGWCPFAHDCKPSFLVAKQRVASKGASKPGEFK